MGDVHLPLIFHSMVQPDASLFEYLLSFNGINLNPFLQRNPITGEVVPAESGMTLLHCLNFIIGGILNGKFDMNRLKQLLSHDDVDINRGREVITPLGQEVRTPLHDTLRANMKFDSDFDLVKTFVEAGANVDRALSAASSQEFEERLEKNFRNNLGFLSERMFVAVTYPLKVRGGPLMRSKHQELLASVRQLIGESGQE